jgi:hypothetical protein
MHKTHEHFWMIGQHAKVLYEHTNGERLVLITKFLVQNLDDKDYFLNQKFIFESPSTRVALNLFDPSLTPEVLRTLADEMEHTQKSIEGMKREEPKKITLEDREIPERFL